MFKVHVSSFFSISICKICRPRETNVLDPPPPDQTIEPPSLLKSDDFFLGNQDILDAPFKNLGHAPESPMSLVLLVRGGPFDTWGGGLWFFLCYQTFF